MPLSSEPGCASFPLFHRLPLTRTAHKPVRARSQAAFSGCSG
jgi:hypothetical protein